VPLEGGWGTEVQIYLFFNLGAVRGWVGSATIRPPYPPERDPVHIEQEAGWASGPVWTGMENLTTVRP
jgi:hypothetical protein